MNRRYALGVIGAAAVAGGAFTLTNRTGGLPELGAAYAAGAEADTSGVLEMTMGAVDAPITLVEYASFTCPHCANFHNGPLKQLKADYIETGKVRFIYRDVYFDRFGLWASMIARCDPNRFFGISDLLYNDQKSWIGSGDPSEIAENLRKVGRIAGLTNEQLETCLSDNDNAKALVAWYEENSTRDEVTSTPTLIIDGDKHSNMTYAELQTLLDKKLGTE